MHALCKTIRKVDAAERPRFCVAVCALLFAASSLTSDAVAAAALNLPKPGQAFPVSERTNKAWNFEDADDFVQPYVDDILENLPDGSGIDVDWETLGLRDITDDKAGSWKEIMVVQNALLVTAVQVQLAILAKVISGVVDAETGSRERAAFAEPLNRFQRIVITAAPDACLWKSDPQLQAAWIDPNTKELIVHLRRRRLPMIKWRAELTKDDEITFGRRRSIGPGLPDFYPTYYAVVSESALSRLIDPIDFYYFVRDIIDIEWTRLHLHPLPEGDTRLPWKFVIPALNTTGACQRMASLGLIEKRALFLPIYLGLLTKDEVDGGPTLGVKIYHNADGLLAVQLNLNCFYQTKAIHHVNNPQQVMGVTPVIRFAKQFDAHGVRISSNRKTKRFLLEPPNIIPTNDPLFDIFVPGQNLSFVVVVDEGIPERKRAQGYGYSLFFEAQSRDGQQIVRWRGQKT